MHLRRPRVDLAGGAVAFRAGIGDAPPRRVIRSGLLAIVLLAGCSVTAVEDEQLERAHQAFVGGRRVTELPGVGYLVRDGITSCSGSLVEPDLVLTAAHCVNDPDETIEFGWGETSARQKIGSVARALHPRFIVPPRNGGVVFQGFDIALVRLEHAIDLPLIQTGATPHSGKVRAIGYGATSYVEDADGKVEPRGVGSERRSAEGFIIGENPTEMFVRFDLGSSACYGDSGSPLFAEDGSAVGVLSRFTGRTRCEPRMGSVIGYTRIDRMGDFFQAAKACLDAGDVASCLREDDRALCDTPRFQRRTPMRPTAGDERCGATELALDAHEERTISVTPPEDVELTLETNGDARMHLHAGGAASSSAELAGGKTYDLVVRSCNGTKQAVVLTWRPRSEPEARGRFPCGLH